MAKDGRYYESDLNNESKQGQRVQTHVKDSFPQNDLACSADLRETCARRSRSKARGKGVVKGPER